MKSLKYIIFISLFLFSYPALAKQPGGMGGFQTTGPVDIEAQSVEHDRETNIFTARGNVELTEIGRSLKADYMTYNDNTKDVYAEGNVIYQDMGDRVECDVMRLNLETKKGTLENGRIFIKEGNVYIAGQEMEKTGEARYHMKKGEFTTCGWDKPAWKFAASDVDVTMEGYAKTKSTTFHILDYPVFYFPYGVFPVKTERQSGFLIPDISLSTRNGTVINNAYFWAISKDKDATFYLNYIEDRGFNFGTEFRYASSDDFKGQWDYFIIKDKEYDGTRWRLRGKHENKFFKDLQLKTDIQLVSDMDYLKDFGVNVAERSENQIRSTAFVEKPLTGSLFTGGLSYYRSLLSKDNNSTYQRLPYLSFFTEYIPLLGGIAFTDFSSEFVSFQREKGDTFSRLALEPKIRFPFSIHGINFLVSGTLMETAYLVNRSDTIDNTSHLRSTFRLEGDANMQFVRNFVTDFLDIGEAQSLIKPQLKYAFTPNTSYRDLPYIDPYDRIYQTNSITYSLNHYLYGLKEGAQRELALFEISQTYGLSDKLESSPLYSGSGNRLSDIVARLTLYPLGHLSYTSQATMNVNGEGLQTWTNSLSHKKPGGKYYIDLWHSYAKDTVNEVFLDIGGRYGPFEGAYQIRHSFKDQDWIDTLYRLTYRPGCWATTVSLNQTKRPRDTSINISFELIGITMK